MELTNYEEVWNLNNCCGNYITYTNTSGDYLLHFIKLGHTYNGIKYASFLESAYEDEHDFIVLSEDEIYKKYKILINDRN